MNTDTKEPIARTVVRAIFFSIIALSYGNFNPALVGIPVYDTGGDDAQPQQYLIGMLWAVLIGCSLFPGVMRAPLRTRGLFWPGLLLGYILVSPAWSDDPASMAPKAVALLLCTTGIWRIASIFSVKEVFDIMRGSLCVLVAASVIALIVDPGNAISREFRFEANDFENLWQGIYGQKQGLGVVAADFVFLILMQWVNRRKPLYLLYAAVGVVLIVGSGSRGGAITAVAGPLAIIAARRYPRLFPVIISAFMLELAVALAGIAYLAVTGNDSFLIMGNEIDFTQRSLIWQFDVGMWLTRPIFGFGLNGFWSDPKIIWDFLRVHNWVVANHHSGYLAILVETGVVGMGLFGIVVWQLCSRLLAMLRRAAPSESLEIAIGILVLTFTINFTETIFLRSTNFGEVLFTFLLINIFSPVYSARRVRQEPIWQPQYN